jgi:hypothetical protein
MKRISLRSMKRAGLCALALAALLAMFGPAPAEARVFVHLGIGGPYYGYPAYPPYAYYPPPYPYYYPAPPPVVYAPPPAVYAPPPPPSYPPYATPPAAYTPPSGPAYAPYATPPGYSPQ